MKIELHNLLSISLWEEEYTSIIIRGKYLIIVSREGKPKTVKFPFNLKNFINPSSHVEIQNVNQDNPDQTIASPSQNLIHSAKPCIKMSQVSQTISAPDSQLNCQDASHGLKICPSRRRKKKKSPKKC